MKELQKSWLVVRSQTTHLRCKTIPSPSVIFSYTFLPTGLPPSLAAADSDSKTQPKHSCWPKGMVCVCFSTSAEAAHPTFHKAFVLLGDVYSPKTGFPKRFPWSQS